MHQQTTPIECQARAMAPQKTDPVTTPADRARAAWRPRCIAVPIIRLVLGPGLPAVVDNVLRVLEPHGHSQQSAWRFGLRTLHGCAMLDQRVNPAKACRPDDKLEAAGHTDIAASVPPRR
ncbi:hypothetical protein GCM10007880_57850 [Mesorhizobium amorphae]|nr:hypothetical protein GCM10007880_57850 [Mesorhizobium amorphae]